MDKKITACLLGAALLFAPTQSSYAEVQPKSNLSQEDEAKARANMTYLGIDEKTQNKLVQNIEGRQFAGLGKSC